MTLNVAYTSESQPPSIHKCRTTWAFHYGTPSQIESLILKGLLIKGQVHQLWASTLSPVGSAVLRVLL